MSRLYKAKENKEFQNSVTEAVREYKRTGQLYSRCETVLMTIVREGVEYHTFQDLLDKYPFSVEDWANYLHLSERTLQRYKKESKNFDAPQSERILQISLFYQRGLEVFGDRTAFDTWLTTVSIGLGGIKPKELLDNSFGIALLEEELTRIEHGVLA